MENLEHIEQSTAIVEVKKKTGEIVEIAKSVEISTDEDANKTSILIQDISKMKKSVNEQRLFFTKPLNDQVKKINDLFKTLSAPLVEADGIVRSKVLEYRQKQQEIARKEEERLEKLRIQQQKRIDKIAEEKGVEAPKLETPKVEAAAPMQGVTTRKTWTFKVVDLDKVPRGFMILDEKSVKTAIKNGVREINGLEIFEEEKIVSR